MSELDTVEFDELVKRMAYHDAAQREMIRQLQEQLKTARYEAVRRFVHGEDKMCLVCAAKEPCKLKDDPSSPCTFEPTPMELLAKVRQQAERIQALERDNRSYIDERHQHIAIIESLEAELTALKATRVAGEDDHL